MRPLWLLLVLTACHDEVEPEGAGGSAGSAPLECGALEVAVDDACVSVGVGDCGEGFVADERGGCDPILPDTPCGPGELALLGETACRPLSPCTGSRWGRAPIEPSTEFVDASFTGVSDGSEAAPWHTISQAISAALPGAVVAVAAGTYPETVWLSTPVHLWGSCATDVIVEAPAGDAGLFMLADAADVHDIGVRGQGDGVVASALDLTVERVWVRDTENFVGVAVIDANGPAGLVMRDSLIESTRTLGILAAGGELTVERVVVRSIRPDALGFAGAGIGAILSPESGAASHARIDRVVVMDVYGSGITLEGSEASVDQSLVQRVQSQAADGSDGEGVIAAQGSQLTMARSVVAEVHEAGILAVASTATLSDITVRDVAVQASPPANGIGIVAQTNATVSIDRALLERSYTANMMLLESNGTLQHAILREAVESDGLVVFAQALPAVGTVARSRLEGHPRAGSSTFGGGLSFEATMFECNLFHLVVEPWNGVPGIAEDVGQNHCGCDGAPIDCKALSQNLMPPEVGF